MSEHQHDDEFDQPRSVEAVDKTPLKDARTGRSAAAARGANQTSWVDQQIRLAMAKGEFDNLPGAGKPIERNISAAFNGVKELWVRA